MIIAVSGSTGLIGTALVEALEGDGHLVRRLVRREARPGGTEIEWDPSAGKLDASALEGVDGVVHLAGENLAGKRWTPQFKQRILESRTLGTTLLCETLAKLNDKPEVLCSASAIGYYGDRGDELVDESSPPGKGFLAEVCGAWEEATDPARDANIRVINLRIGVVLSEKGGALASMRTPFSLGLGGPIGSGRQYLSWIALEDLVAIIREALVAKAMMGPVNAVAPQPVTNREFAQSLAKALGRPALVPMPAFAARLAFGEMADEMLLGGARVDPRVLRNLGFRYRFPNLEEALRAILSK